MIYKNRQVVTTSLLILFLIACGSAKQVETSQAKPLNLFESLPDASEKKTLVGIVTKEQIMLDTAFNWYDTNLKYYKADSTTVQTIREKKDAIHLVLFCGTWCHDSQQLVPKYFTTLQAANFPDKHLTIVGMDRSKKTIAQLEHTFNITNVPTMVVMQNGKEVGRIVEYGETTFVDKELGEIIAAIPAN
ncbi:MAG: thioredoxin family protein [Bacteroidota bacterium]